MFEPNQPKSPHYIPKSRYSSISRYISNRPQCKEEYNDIPCPQNEDIKQFAKEKAKELDIEIDDQLLQHLGFLFIRDPLVVFPDKIYMDDSCYTNHFEVTKISVYIVNFFERIYKVQIGIQ